MKRVRPRDAIDGSPDSHAEQQDVGDDAQSRSETGYHCACTNCLDEQDEREDAHDVVVAAEGCEVWDAEVVDPDDEDGEVDGEDPEKEKEDGGGVACEVEGGEVAAGVVVGGCQVGVAGGADAGCELDDAENEVGELVWDDGCDEKDED